MWSVKRACFVCLTTHGLFSTAKVLAPVVSSAVHTEVKDGCPLALLSALISRLIGRWAVEGRAGRCQQCLQPVLEARRHRRASLCGGVTSSIHGDTSLKPRQTLLPEYKCCKQMRCDETAGRQHGDAEWEAVADDVLWEKHHLQFPAVWKIQQIFVCSRWIPVSVLPRQ